MSQVLRSTSISVPLILLLAWGLGACSTLPFFNQNAKGFVFEDLNRNGKKDRGEPGISGIRVSDGVDITRTKSNGYWTLPKKDRAIYSVLKPKNWMVHVDEWGFPAHYYIHRASPTPGSAWPTPGQTGPLPSSINFGLHRQEEPKQLSVLMFGDTQPRDSKELHWMTEDVLPEALESTQASFGLILGDLVFDNLGLFQPLTNALAGFEMPWWMVVGNHDLNRDAPDDSWANETFQNHFGPADYAFDWGPIHVLILDNVLFQRREDGSNGYHAELTPESLSFAKQDLAQVPHDKVLVVAMHIPLNGLRNRDELFRLIEPFEKSVSVAAHTHTQRVHEFTKNDGWMGAEPHTHVVHVTPCGSWWSGEPDQRGIPHATMSDGAPNGWLEWSFTEKDWAFQFEASGPQRNESMHATLQPASSGDGGTISVNVWGGTPRTLVEVKEVASNAWRTLKRTKAPDPFFLALREDDQANLSKNGGWRSLPKPSTCEHLWVGNYQDHPTGEVLIRVTDPWGGVEEKTFIAP